MPQKRTGPRSASPQQSNEPQGPASVAEVRKLIAYQRTAREHRLERVNRISALQSLRKEVLWADKYLVELKRRLLSGTLSTAELDAVESELSTAMLGYDDQIEGWQRELVEHAEFIEFWKTELNVDGAREHMVSGDEPYLT